MCVFYEVCALGRQIVLVIEKACELCEVFAETRETVEQWACNTLVQQGGSTAVDEMNTGWGFKDKEMWQLVILQTSGYYICMYKVTIFECTKLLYLYVQS